MLFPNELYVSRSLRQLLKKDKFQITIDTAFPQVIRSCAISRDRDKEGTWITSQMEQAYIELFRLGHAHSVESWLNGMLVGGLYGVSMGAVFFGESMFFHESGASKAAFVYLAQRLLKWGFKLIDCQVSSDYLIDFGAREIPRSDFIALLNSAINGGQLFGSSVNKI